ncbi:MAG TPA: hypothetical protein PKM88_06515 [bacterium]|nr:hypothetical protein [bacterium]
MNEQYGNKRRSGWQLAGLIIGLLGAGCAAVSAVLAYQAGHLARAGSVLGAGVCVAAMCITQYFRRS